MKTVFVLGMITVLSAAVFGQDNAAAQTTADADTGIAAPVLKIATDPPGAVVTVGGKEYGETPVEITDLAVGQHTLELSLPGHFRRKATIQLDSAGAELNFELSRPASIAVTSEPPGALVTISGDTAGTTPAYKERLRPDEYQLSISMDGYEHIASTIKLASGANDTAHFVLTPIPPPPPQEQTPAAAAPEEKLTNEKSKADGGKGKKTWLSETILIAFFVFVAVMIGVEKASY